jgi:DNA polymerase-3 subunit alpha
LYRPGPLEYIPNFIARKHGREAIAYDLPEMKEYLEDTYGITVYQEQVMLLSQKLANFTKGDADVLRKAMGKKDKATLDKMKNKFLEGIRKNGHKEDTSQKVWSDWEAFAQYAFNKSHSTCYAFVAFQTAYLKAHYPAEYMSSVLTHNLSNIDKITFFMEESKRMGIPVLGPDVNESAYQFAVNDNGQIRFGLGAMKGVGEGAVQAIVDERNANGPYKSVFDLVSRINLRSANKKTFESLAYGGAFDSFPELHRAQYFFTENGGTFLEKILRYGTSLQESKNSSQTLLFDDSAGGEAMPMPKIPVCEPWGNIEQLKYEKEVIGFYISGHPLDSYRFEMSNFCPNKVSDLKDMPAMKGRELTFGGMITAVNHRISKNGKPFGNFTVEDYNDSFELVVFGEDYLRFKLYMNPGHFVHIKGKVQERFNQSDLLEFKISSMQLLSDVRDKLMKNITVSIPLEQVSDELIERLLGAVNENAKRNPGKCALKFVVVDKQEGISVEMPARKIKVYPDNHFLDSLNRMPELNYRVN